MDIVNQLPTTDKDFIKNEDPSKNSTKLEVDMKKNAPFIKELQQKIAACTDPEVARKMEEEFEAATGISFDDAVKAAEKGEVVTIENPDGSLTVERKPKSNEDSTDETKEDSPVEDTCESCNIFGGAPKNDEKPVETETVTSSTIEAAKSSNVVETGEEAVDPEEMKLLAEVLSKLEEYKKDPSKLKIGQESIDIIAQTGVFGDKETVAIMIDAINKDVDELINHENPESMYHDEEVYTEAVKKTLEIKISLEQAEASIKDITDPAFIQELFAAKYPEYVEKGPASVLNAFNEYLKRRIESSDERSSLCKELMSKSKIENIVKNANDNIFKSLRTQSGSTYTLSMFVQTIYVVTKNYIKDIVGFEKAEDVKFKDAESLVTIFSILFLRYTYKKLVDNMGSRKLQKKFFIGFIFDITNPNSLTEEKRNALKDAWTSVWKSVAEIESNLVELEKSGATATK